LIPAPHIPAVEIVGVTKRFRRLRSYRDLLAYPFGRPDVLALDGISLRIEQGEVFGLLGRNGAGKTTLIRILTTSLLPTSGQAFVLGRNVVSESAHVRSSIGLVPTRERSFYGRLSGRRNLEFFAALEGLSHRARNVRIDALVDAIGLGAFVDRPVETYSTGMRQKLAIARGLLVEPSLLFLDEPTSALDPISAREVRKLIQQPLLSERRRTVILATHSMAEAEELCDRIALVQAGKVVALGTVDELAAAMGFTIVCELRVPGPPPSLLPALARIEGVSSVDEREEGELTVLTLRLREAGDLFDAVIQETLAAGARLHGCTTRKASLEEIYVKALADERQPEGAIA
jgi:ABC-2 type transport system ATP-binding protein